MGSKILSCGETVINKSAFHKKIKYHMVIKVHLSTILDIATLMESFHH